jgi:hypothetical protein
MRTRCLTRLLLDHWVVVDQHNRVDHRSLALRPLGQVGDGEGQSGSKGSEGPARGDNRRPSRAGYGAEVGTRRYAKVGGWSIVVNHSISAADKA